MEIVLARRDAIRHTQAENFSQAYGNPGDAGRFVFRMLITACFVMMSVLWPAGSASLLAQQATESPAVKKDATPGTSEETASGGSKPGSPTEAGDTARTPAAPVPVSDAERITSLQRSIETDEARIKELRKDLDDPKSSYAQADVDFKKLSDQLDDLKKSARQAEADANATLLKELNEKIATVEKSWQDAKRRFELEIESRRTKQESLESLTARTKSNKELLEKLRNPDKPDPEDAAVTDPAAAMPGTPAVSTPATTSAPSAAAPAASTPAAVSPIPGIPATTTTASPSTTTEQPVKDEVVLEAESIVEARKKQAAAAQLELDKITQRVKSLQNNIQLERRLRDLARQKALEADAEAQRLRQEYWKKLSSGEGAEEVRKSMEGAQTRQRSAQEEATAASNHLDELQSALALVQADQITAMQVAEERRQEMNEAQRQLESVSSPWSLHRIERWLTHEGLRIVIVLLVATIALWVASAVRKRLVDLLVSRSRRGSVEERQNRAKTLVAVFHNAFITFVYGFVTVVVLEAVGYSVAPLLGGAAVLGLAVAFGAQSLIKDYFNGFIVLMEQQYMLNDVIKVGAISGQVERITLRMTVLRDLEGSVHFIPHGQITTVTNMTHGWSRALFTIQVGYGSDVDRATRVLMELAREIRRDPAYAALITEEPAMLGVDELGNSGIVIKFHITTRPLQQWTVKRELLRRIKIRFDEEGIEIPFPQLKLHTTQDDPLVVPEPPPPNPLLA